MVPLYVSILMTHTFKSIKTLILPFYSKTILVIKMVNLSFPSIGLVTYPKCFWIINSKQMWFKNFFRVFKVTVTYFFFYNIFFTYILVYLIFSIFLFIKRPVYAIPNVYDFNIRNLPHEKLRNLTSRSVFPYSVQWIIDVCGENVYWPIHPNTVFFKIIEHKLDWIKIGLEVQCPDFDFAPFREYWINIIEAYKGDLKMPGYLESKYLIGKLNAEILCAVNPLDYYLTEFIDTESLINNHLFDDIDHLLINRSTDTYPTPTVNVEWSPTRNVPRPPRTTT